MPNMVNSNLDWSFVSLILKGHLQPVCIAAVHFTETIFTHTEITNVPFVLDIALCPADLRQQFT